MGKMRSLKDGLMTVLAAMPATSDGTKLQQVIDNTSLMFDKYPSAAVLPNNQVNATLATHQNERTASYVVLVYLQLEDSPDGESTTYNTMYDLMDIIVDGLDGASYNFGYGTLILESKYAGYEVSAESKAGAILVLRIDVDIRYSKDI